MLSLTQTRFIPNKARCYITDNKRLILPLLLLISLAVPASREFTLQALSDAFFQVSVFVAATLLIYYYLIDRLPQLQLSYLRAKSGILEVSFASILGALPGCGGAIIVVTQFTKKQASFGSVVAVLTATMGDAAFLLLATRPLDGLLMMLIGVAVGIISGQIVNTFHNPNQFQPDEAGEYSEQPQCQPRALKFSRPIWKFTLVPSLIIASVIATNSDLSAFSHSVNTGITLFGSIMALFTVVVWSLSSKGNSYKQVTSEEAPCTPPSKLTKVLMDTHFVTAWVVASFMLFEILVNLVGVDLTAWFSEYAYLAPLVTVAIGLLPGCGPQIVVMTLYIQGITPFSAMAANAISNDGDALFPAIALAPKAALMATVYSTIPALLLGYGLYYYGI
ncbi:MULTISPECIES: putative manganese transporter [Pseudoalteromonas]|uniref:putative manganese transporter n=1 Tax=Pseudoalteromonas TaxID=53246 RepID=UPI0015824096|nr:MULTISPECIES: putative manganese transporter [Pseudoalteromonas]MDI4650676.1 putative manganese transporter [Pseudoalteromonas shioyasakiensis]NUJ37095.1 arsenic efflux protein [Pseudoalteromonas sp. 0303]